MKTDIGQVLGMLMASVAHARRFADEESAAIAEYYKEHPLLEGMSVPRIRLPDVTLDLPFLIESCEEGKPNVMADLEKIKKTVFEELKKITTAEKLTISKEFSQFFEREMMAELEWLMENGAAGRSISREAVVRAVDSALAHAINAYIAVDCQRAWQNVVAPSIRKITSKIALKEVGTPSRIITSIITAEVKEKASLGSAPRLRLCMKEEGLEWSVDKAADGSVTKRLVPE